jgi:ABC-type transport system substrate-binding protein
MRKRFAIFSLSFFFLGACKQMPERADHTVFRYNEAAGISSLDPAFARSQSNIWAVNQLFSGLVQMDRELRTQPAIASSWQISDSGRTYQFQLRQDVYFHSDRCFGKDSTRIVKAHDFVYSFKRLTSSELASPGAWVFKKVKGFKAINDSLLEIQLSDAFAPFLGILSMKYCAVVPQEGIEFYGKDFSRKPIGTGPFKFQFWAENEKLVLRNNQNYFEVDEEGNSLPYLKAIAISFIPDKQSAFLEFLKGKNDLISGIDLSYKDELLDPLGNLNTKYSDRFKLYRQPYLNTEYLAFFVDSTKGRGAWQDSRIRQAINYGFDRVKMMRYLRNNIGEPALKGFIPKGLPAFDSLSNFGYSYNPEKARLLLAEAGFPEGRGLEEIKLQTNASYLDLCEYLQSELSKIGISIQVEVSPPSTLRQAMATGKVDFFRASWIADYPDAENYLSLFYSSNAAPNGPNYSHFSSPEFDSLYDASAIAIDDSLRVVMYRKMDSIIMKEAPIIPLFYDQVLRFYPKHIIGLEGNALNLLDLKKVRKLEGQS